MSRHGETPEIDLAPQVGRLQSPFRGHPIPPARSWPCNASAARQQAVTTVRGHVFLCRIGLVRGKPLHRAVGLAVQNPPIPPRVRGVTVPGLAVMVKAS